MDDPRTLPSIEELNGHELYRAKKDLGRPLLDAMEHDFDAALYTYVWICEQRDQPQLSKSNVMDRPFGEVMAAFQEANATEDPTDAGSGGS